jgi:hypothetical protein
MQHHIAALALLCSLSASAATVETYEAAAAQGKVDSMNPAHRSWYVQLRLSSPRLRSMAA